MTACIIIGTALFLFGIFLYVTVKSSQKYNKAVSLNMKADEPVSKSDSGSKATNKGEQ